MLSSGTNTDLIDLNEGRSEFRKYAKSTLPRKVEALLAHKDFQSKLSWIANKLDSSLDEINDALQLLEALDIIEWNNNEITAKVGYIDFGQKFRGSRTKSAAVDDHRLISHQLLNDVNPDDRYFVANGFISTDEETFKEYNRRLLELRDWFNEESMKSKKTIVAGYSFTATNVLTPDNNRGEQ